MSDEDLGQFEFSFDEEDICENYHGGEAFSENAHDTVISSKAILRERIVAHLKQVGDGTSDECEVDLGMPHQTCSARFSELKRAGRIIPVLDDDGNHVSRPTRQGRPAGVYGVKPQEVIKQ